MIAYIIKFIICSGMLLAIYFLLLQKEKIYQFNRLYLLLVIPLSLLVPVIPIEFDSAASIDYIYSLYEEPETQRIAVIDTPNSLPDERQKISALPWSTALIVCYGIISFVLLIRFFTGLIKAMNAIRSHDSKKIEHAAVIVLIQPTIPHTFLHYVFINHADVNNKQILTHEVTHAKQKHSVDILFVELLHCFLWINPFLILLKRIIKLNHEFIADEAVVGTGSETAEYQRLLLTKQQSFSQSPLASSFSYALTKKRFVMMTTQKNPKRSVIKIALCSILVCLVAFLFSEKAYSQATDKGTAITAGDTVKGATQQMISEFDSLIEKFKVHKEKPYEHIALNITRMTDEERKRIQTIYNTMSENQKASYPKAIMFVAVPSPHLPRKSPTAKQLKDWMEGRTYGVWLDGKRIDNAELKNYKASEISHYTVSRLLKNAYTPGKHTHQVDLLTQKRFDELYSSK